MHLFNGVLLFIGISLVFVRVLVFVVEIFMSLWNRLTTYSQLPKDNIRTLYH